MNKLFKLLVLLLTIEFFLGYVIYFKNSSQISGHYSSSTLTTLVKLTKIFSKDEIKKNDEIKIDEELININCKNAPIKNQTFNIAGFNSFRKKLTFQSDLNFLNLFNSDKDYLILILGNSETFGTAQEEQKRLHSIIQKKLRNKINSYDEYSNNTENGKIFVVNLAYLGGMMSDHLTDLLNFSNIHAPDLVIFYTGGNELLLPYYYEGILQNEIYSFRDNKFYSISDLNSQEYNLNILKKCLHKEIFFTKENFYKEKIINKLGFFYFKDNLLFLNLEKHIKNVFNEINNKLMSNSVNFSFYLQPLDTRKKDSIVKINDYEQYSNISISNENFINLNLLKKDLKLNYSDIFHTTDAELISDLLFNDIWKKYEKNIKKKIIN